MNSREYRLGNMLIEKAQDLDKNSAEFKQICQNVIDTNNAELNYLFARNVEGADVKKHGEVVLRSKDPSLNYLFATEVVGADIEAHKDVIAQSGDKFFLQKLIYETTPIDELELWLEAWGYMRNKNDGDVTKMLSKQEVLNLFLYYKLNILTKYLRPRFEKLCFGDKTGTHSM